MLDRTQAPPFSRINYRPLQEVEKLKKNGVGIHILNAHDHPIVKLEIVLRSGTWYESKLSESWFTAKMLLEGCLSKTGKEIHEAFEQLGAFIEIEPGFDTVNFAVYGLRRNFTEVIQLFNEILNTPTFPISELETMKNIRSEQIRMNDSKNNLFAAKKIREVLFGNQHAYGKGLSAQDINNITQSDLINYHEKKLFRKPEIFISGQVDRQLINFLESELKLPSYSDSVDIDHSSISGNREIYIQRDDSLQSSIRIAWHAIDRRHSSYFNYSIASAVLGGYFGSRLMKNIREDKGYTYGISAHPIHLLRASFAVISTDVKAETTTSTIKEIWKEIEQLRAGRIDQEELDMVTNYLAGKFQQSLSTPFEVMGKFKSLNKFGLSYDHYEQYFEALKDFEAARLGSIVDQYFDPAKAHIVIVGNR